MNGLIGLLRQTLYPGAHLLRPDAAATLQGARAAALNGTSNQLIACAHLPHPAPHTARASWQAVPHAARLARLPARARMAAPATWARATNACTYGASPALPRHKPHVPCLAAHACVMRAVRAAHGERRPADSKKHITATHSNTTVTTVQIRLWRSSNKSARDTPSPGKGYLIAILILISIPIRLHLVDTDLPRPSALYPRAWVACTGGVPRPSKTGSEQCHAPQRLKVAAAACVWQMRPEVATGHGDRRQLLEVVAGNGGSRKRPNEAIAWLRP